MCKSSIKVHRKADKAEGLMSASEELFQFLIGLKEVKCLCSLSAVTVLCGRSCRADTRVVGKYSMKSRKGLFSFFKLSRDGNYNLSV